MKRIRNLRFLTGFIIFVLLLSGALDAFASYIESAGAMLQNQAQSDGVDVHIPRFGAESLRFTPDAASDPTDTAISKYIDGEVEKR